MDALSILPWLAATFGFLAFARYRGASLAEVAIGLATGLLLTAVTIGVANVLGLEVSLWALVGLVIGLVLFITVRWFRQRRNSGPAKSPFDFS